MNNQQISQLTDFIKELVTKLTQTVLNEATTTERAKEIGLSAPDLLMVAIQGLSVSLSKTLDAEAVTNKYTVEQKTKIDGVYQKALHKSIDAAFTTQPQPPVE